MTSFILYLIALTSLAFSFFRDKEKTGNGLIKAGRSFLKLLPDIAAIMCFVGITLAVLDPQVISKVIGSESGIFGVFLALITGSLTLIPSFVAFPLAASLLNGGAGYPQVAAFVSTLMAVGIATLPVEIRFFNKTTAVVRNGIALLTAMAFTVVIWWVM